MALPYPPFVEFLKPIMERDGYRFEEFENEVKIFRADGSLAIIARNHAKERVIVDREEKK